MIHDIISTVLENQESIYVVVAFAVAYSWMRL